MPTGGGGAPSLPSFATASNVNDPSSDDQDERVKTFGKAPVIVKVVSVILIVESVGGFLMNLMSNPGTKFVGWGVGLAVRIVIACAVARGSRGARDFLIAIGALALIAGALMLHCFDPADFGGKETGFAMKFLGGGIFNLLMGLLLCTRSAREWLKPR